MFFSGVCEVLPGILYGILGIPCSTLDCCMFPEKRCIVFPLGKGGYKHQLTCRVKIGLSLQDLNKITKSCEVCIAGRTNVSALELCKVEQFSLCSLDLRLLELVSDWLNKIITIKLKTTVQITVMAVRKH